MEVTLIVSANILTKKMPPETQRPATGKIDKTKNYKINNFLVNHQHAYSGISMTADLRKSELWMRIYDYLKLEEVF